MANLGYPNTVLVAYPTRGKAAAFSVPADKQVWIYNARSFNNEGNAQSVGICRKHINSQLALYRYTAVATVYTAVALPLAGTTTFFSAINDGIIFQDRRRFNLIGLHIVTGQATGVYAYEYWNGSAFTALTTLTTVTFTSASNNADQWTSFRAPSDWVAGGPTGVNQDSYSIKVKATTAPAAGVTMNEVWMSEFLEYYDAVPNNAAVQLSFPDTKPFLLNGGEGLHPYYATASAANQFGCFYTIAQ